GTSESGFRGEVEAEQTLQRGERLLAMIENHEHLDLRGPGAQEAQMRLTNLQPAAPTPAASSPIGDDSSGSWTAKIPISTLVASSHASTTPKRRSADASSATTAVRQRPIWQAANLYSAAMSRSPPKM